MHEKGEVVRVVKKLFKSYRGSSDLVIWVPTGKCRAAAVPTRSAAHWAEGEHTLPFRGAQGWVRLAHNHLSLCQQPWPSKTGGPTQSVHGAVWQWQLAPPRNRCRSVPAEHLYRPFAAVHGCALISSITLNKKPLLLHQHMHHALSVSNEHQCFTVLQNFSFKINLNSFYNTHLHKIQSCK